MRAVNHTLTDRQISTAKPQDKPWKLFDAGGLFVRVSPKGTKTWCYAYTSPVTGKRGEVTFGQYPEVGLKAARVKHEEAREQVAAGVDPAAAKRDERAQKAAQVQEAKDKAMTFQAFCEVYYREKMGDKSPNYVLSRKQVLAKHVYPSIGEKPISDVDTDDLLAILNRMRDEKQRNGKVGVKSQAVKTLGFLENIFHYAAQKRATKEYTNPAAPLKGYIEAPRAVNHAHTDEKGVGEFWRDIAAQQGGAVDPAVIAAVRVLTLTWLRKNEVCGMRWRNVNFDSNLITIEADEMKMRAEHRVPMSTQVRTLMLEQRERNIANGRTVEPDDYVFRAFGNRAPRLNGTTINLFFSRIASPFPPHGLRSTGATLMEGQRADPVIIEMCLAHAKKGIVAVYQRHARMDERRDLLQRYADLVESLAAGANVVGIGAKAA